MSDKITNRARGKKSAGKVPVILAGAGGRMGSALIRLLADHAAMELAAAWEKTSSPFYGKDAGEIAPGKKLGIKIGKTGETPALPPMARRAVLVDFSHADAIAGLCRIAQTQGWAYVCGTTGLGVREKKKLAAAGRKIPVLYSGNMSLGIAVLARLARETAGLLGADWDIEILDFHHRAKRDAPSGTALLLGEAVRAGRRGAQFVSARAGTRRQGEIGFAALRGGTAAGEHQILFAGPQERLVLSHSAEHRDIFAKGALEAASWLQGKDKGFFALDDLFADDFITRGKA